MDCSTNDAASDVAHDSPENSGSCSDDDVPLPKKPHRKGKQSRGNGHRAASKSAKNKSATDDSSDDEPLTKKKTPAKKPEKKGTKSSKSNGTNDKKAAVSDINSDDGSDKGKIGRKSCKGAKKSSPSPPKKSEGDTESESEVHSSADDETFCEVPKKTYPRRKASAPPRVIKSQRNAGRGKVKYVETSSDNSDDKPLPFARVTKGPIEPMSSPEGKKTKPKGKSPKEDPSYSDSRSEEDDDDDDDKPLVKLAAKKKKKPGKKNAKKATASPGRELRKRRGLSDESSDYEPSSNIGKKKRTGKRSPKKPKASPRKKKKATPKKPRKKSESESEPSSHSSDDEPLTKAATHPQVTKILDIILEV
ncbi:nucleolar protein dao-5-like [Pseudoliparis swirei]|uniref:nucleolar protein dao-5-like n=1 Tax=Pseudoliparis swirei TaxID=2059687 RepID=UPI0024BE4656|nr:nucleolar protein dao-5-like [Pseudoliparis swirei]